MTLDEARRAMDDGTTVYDDNSAHRQARQAGTLTKERRISPKEAARVNDDPGVDFWFRAADREQGIDRWLPAGWLSTR